VISGLIAGYNSLARFVSRIWTLVIRALLNANFPEITIQFFTEAAVLVAVFPVLDAIIDSLNGGPAKVTWQLVLWSEGIAGFLLLLAGIMSGRSGD